MTVTTSRRPELFCKMVESLARTNFQEIIKRCVIIDDHSDEGDQAKMVELMRQTGVVVELLKNEAEGPWRHVHSLNAWLKLIQKEEIVFHCEDDWEFDTSASGMLWWGLEILGEFEWVGQACFNHIDHRTTRRSQNEKFWIRTLANCPPDADWRSNPWHWPSRFTLNPGLTRVCSLSEIGPFMEQPMFEREFGNRWTYAGWTTVYHDPGFCHHIGRHQSAYDLNGTMR